MISFRNDEQSYPDTKSIATGGHSSREERVHDKSEWYQHPSIIHERMAWMLYYQQTRSARKVCDRFKISRKTFYKWWNRFQQSGYNSETLKDQSRKPRRSPHATPKDVVAQLIQAHIETGFGQRRLKSYLEEKYNISLSEHTIWKLLKRHITGGEYLVDEPKLSAQRPFVPGERVLMFCSDVESFGLHCGGVIYTAMDMCTNLRLSKVYDKRTSHSASQFLRIIAEKFPFRIQEVQTPDEPAFDEEVPFQNFVSRNFEIFPVTLRKLHIDHSTFKVDDPMATMITRIELADVDAFFTSYFFVSIEELDNDISEYCSLMNNHRECNQLNGLTPLQKLRSNPDHKSFPYFESHI